jgi:radical SAM protein with 4Fe4S-binding SPASM domain
MVKEFVSIDDDIFPYTVALELTLACNMSCRHCGSDATAKNRQNQISYEEWKSVIKDLNKLNPTYITFSGGEPFLYPYWRQLLKDTKSINEDLKMCIISNGSLIKEDDIEYMKAAGLGHLALSLDGNQEIHDFIRRFPGAYSRVVNVIRLCQKHNYEFFIVSSINKYNFEIRRNLLDIILMLGVKNWQVQIVNSFGRANELKDEMIIDKKQYVQLIDDIYDWKQQYGDVLKINAADTLGYCYGKAADILDDAEWTGCYAGCFNLAIESNGNVKGCLSLQDDSFIEGNIRERSIIDIWNDPNSFAYTRRYDTSKLTGCCKECTESKVCKAGCTGMAFAIGNTIYENQYCYRNILGQCTS